MLTKSFRKSAVAVKAQAYVLMSEAIIWVLYSGAPLKATRRN